MKTSLTLALLLVAANALALLESIFHGYGWVEKVSPDIALVRCTTNSPPPFPPNHSFFSDINTFSVETVTTIKGTNHVEAALLHSGHWLNVGDTYLVYANYVHGTYIANEKFRVIPLGRELWVGTITNAIAGKPTTEQLQILFKLALENANRQMKDAQEEKQRIEQGPTN